MRISPSSLAPYLSLTLPSAVSRSGTSAFAPAYTVSSIQKCRAFASVPSSSARRRRRLFMTTTTATSSKTTLPSVSKRVAKTLDPCVVLMKELIGQYADQWVDKGGIYSLAQGVVYWKPPESTTQALVDAISASKTEPTDPHLLHMYGPDEGLLTLREALRAKLVAENGLDNHDVMVTVGANQAYMNCVFTLCSEQHHKAVVFAPFYFNHVMALQMTLPESGLVVGPTNVENGFPDLEWLEEQLKADNDIQMVTLVNPGNPTGIHLPRFFLQRAVDLCRKYNCWLILDCAYEYFVPESVFDGCFAEDAAHVIHIFSLSKAYALAGYRCGYVAVSRDSGGVYDQMMKVQDTIPIAPSRISQIAALGALEAGRDWVREKVESLETGKQAILQALAPLEQIIGGSGAMYVMGKLPTAVAATGGQEQEQIPDDQEFARRLVRDYGVAVIPGSFCGFPGWIRVCYANLPPDDCTLAAERLAAGLKDLCRGSSKEEDGSSG